MKRRRIIFAAAVLALLGASCLRAALRIPDPSPQMLSQLRACAAELAEADFLLAYPDWDKNAFSIGGASLPISGSYPALGDVIRILRRDDGLFFILHSDIITGARGYLVCGAPEPTLTENERAEPIREEVYRLTVGWD